ncbi:MAG: nucleoside:proton symporter [Pseudomonadales bacterium]|nr:nucleoside:proton symporter [Pseudomonadales bacterium]
MLPRLQSCLGLITLIGLAFACSENRRAPPPWRWTLGAIALQLLLAVVILLVPAVWETLRAMNAGVIAIEHATLEGSSYMFGYLGGAPLPFDLKPGAPRPVVIAFQILPLIITMSALAALLWHWGVLRQIVRGLSWALRKTLGVSGVVGLNAGANLFLGVVEAPLVVRGWLATISRHELFAVMTLGMSTVSGVVLVLYAQTLSRSIDNSFGHILAASLISLPAALLIARILVPGESRTGATSDGTELRYQGTMDALVRGTLDGLQLFLAVIAVIIVVFSLVALANQMLGALPDYAGAPLTVQRLFGWLFAPLMWLLGVPWTEAATAGSLMGVKAILNEYVAYLELAALPAGSLSPRSMLISIYAMCGFANLASIGLLVSTLTTLCPDRRREIASLGFKSWLAGNLVSMMTGAVVGIVAAG